MILEGIVTTIDVDDGDRLNIAPMGPAYEPASPRFVLRPFKTSTTYQNLRRHGEGVLHVTDDVLLIARSVVGLESHAAVRPAARVKGSIIVDACRYDEFRVIVIEDADDRATIYVESVLSVRVRDFFGFNRAKHLVLEAAILASRADFLPTEELLRDLPRFRTIVHKTGGEPERLAFELVENHIRSTLVRRGLVGNLANAWGAPTVSGGGQE